MGGERPSFVVGWDPDLRSSDGLVRSGLMGAEHAGDLPRDLEHCIESEARGSPDPGRERLAFEQLHDQERLTVREPDVVDLHDPGVRDPTDRTRLVEEALDVRFLLGDPTIQQLDGDAGLHDRLLRSPHLILFALAKAFDEPEVLDRRAPH